MIRKNSNYPGVVVIAAWLLSMIFFISISSAAGTELMTAIQVQPVISDNISEQSREFAFYDDNILWRNVPDPNGTDRLNGGLYLHSLRDNSTRAIATETACGDKWISGQTLSENFIVWSQYPGVLHLYDIRSGEERIIPDAAATGIKKEYSRGGISDIERRMPQISGNRVAWLQGFSSATYGNADIVILDLTTNTMTLVNESASAKGSLSLNGDRVSWFTYGKERDGQRTSIGLQDLVSGIYTEVSPESGLQTQTVLSDNYLAWTDSHNPLRYPRVPSQIHIYNISAGTTMAIPASQNFQSDPFFAGDYVVYSECTPYDASSTGQTCESKIFDIRAGIVLNQPSSGNSRDEKTGYSWKIHDYSRGLFLIEEIQNGERSFGLYRIDNLQPENLPAIVSGTESGLSGNAPSVKRPPGTESATQPSPGFDGLFAVLTVLLMGIVAQNRGRKHKD